MLQELTEHHHTSQQLCFRQCIASTLLDISSLGTSASELMSEVSESDLTSIDTPDIDASSDISIHSDDPLPTSSSDTDSLFLVSDFEVEYYINWEWCYRELIDKILTTRVLNPAPSIPKSSQLHLLDHWRINNPKRFHCKLHVELLTFDALVGHIKDHPIFHNNSNNSQLLVYTFSCTSSFFMPGIMEMPLLLRIPLSGLEFLLVEFISKTWSCLDMLI